MADNKCEGSLYIEIDDKWKNLFCWIRNGKFQAFDKQRVVSVSNQQSKRRPVFEFAINPSSVSCKALNPGAGILNRIALTAGSTLPDCPVLFEIISGDDTYVLACANERDRDRWIHAFDAILQEKSSGFTSMLLGGRSKPSAERGIQDNTAQDTLRDGEGTGDFNVRDRMTSIHRLESISEERCSMAGNAHDMADDEDNQYCCRKSSIFRMKVDTMQRLFKVVSAFPFVIVVATLNISNAHYIFRSVAFIRLMNLLIYIIPFIFVDVLLSKVNSLRLQTLFIGVYISIYLIPVGYVVVQKLKTAAATHKIEEGTFCFRPARAIRLSFPNVFAIQGFVLEFVQHCCYCMPLGIFGSEDQDNTVEDIPPYIQFKIYFWMAVASVFICALLIVLNAVLRGKKHYKLQNAPLIWLFLFTVGGPGYVSVITILFMGLWCDYSEDPPLLVQDRSIVCWERTHTRMAVAALICLAVYLVQMTLLPSGTYKETMRQDELDIMFVPVYLQAHFLLKAIFCGVYVCFYLDDWTRVVTLTVLNIALLVLNSHMKPCSVHSVNVARDTFFIGAVLSGLQSLNYIANAEIGKESEAQTGSTKALYLSTLVTNIIFVCIAMYVYYLHSSRSTKFQIARTFLDLEWQVAKGGSVHPRVLEPLISLTLSPERPDLELAKNYIEQLVWLISYPNIRVQFQSAWGLANIALVDEDARRKIHEAGGTKSLFEWYMDMDIVVQMETLAALVNLTLSYEVADDMVERYKCIPFFISLVSGTKLKHAQFSAIAVGNLARKESFREQIRKHGGIPVLVGCIMSSDYQKKRYGALALANMALSPSLEIVQIFTSKGLLDRIIKMAVRKEIETQREVTALIRNLSCHAHLRPILLERRVIDAIKAADNSVFPEVVEWADEILKLMEKDIVTKDSGQRVNFMSKDTSKVLGRVDRVSQAEYDLLQKMTPLEASVTWSTWGSKLESIFTPIFATLPTLQGIQIYTHMNSPVDVYLAKGLSKGSADKYRDSMVYIIMERPSHGRLNEYSTSSDYVTYTPNDDYCGTDFFTFRVQLGSLSSAAATVAITIDDEAAPSGPSSSNQQGFSRSNSSGKGKQEQYLTSFPSTAGKLPEMSLPSRMKQSRPKANFDPSSML
mmetsp:Transcript_4832/g.7354  ORF Transcript_4832/g.7354 Transcript_4832/m.7354 type:complete len:1127 (+) Transcript_4832:113-3493(+)|eukprot:CAMPEP_0185033770 /NCGR_PEP_ID=MMETSP1103-20130426/23072_1 /TAXON_ID=36769 /ORGANISM="Paraphysomonas bandaiensis, Strain Caron Lab Isolate" /LENGTH=1126 /DNA_ID=CAMNT_0027570171 /DNA_START=44 /DNA_END=3424 /DNA_ORIENTATION=+